MMRSPLAFLICVLSFSRWAAGEQTDSPTCPDHCKCSGTELSCQNLQELPSLDEIPFTFTEFRFQECHLNKLTRLPAAYANATELLILNSDLSSVDDDAFQLLGELRTLELSGNRLADLSRAALSPLQQLTKLDLSRNRLHALPDELFKDVAQLRELCLDDNFLAEFGDGLFEGAERLVKLTCNKCRLQSVPAKSLQRIANLQHLELNQNPLQRLSDDAFDGLESKYHPLLRLSLDNCSLETVGRAALRPFKTLQHLNLGHNKLTYIAIGTFKHFWESLTSLSIESNLLTAVDERLAPWSFLQEVKLAYNLWICDCRMAWIKKVDIGKVDKENVTCASPPALQGHDLHAVVTAMNCPDRRYYLIVGFGVPVVVVALVGAVCCAVKLSSRSKLRRGASVKYQPVRDSTTNSRQFLVE